MNEFSDEVLAKKMDQIRKLLERADHPSTPQGESDSCRQRAESLMFRYRLEESMAINAGTSSNAPVWRDMNLDVADSEFARFYYHLAGTVIHHVGARGEVGYRVDEETGKVVIRLQATGYSQDLNYMDVLLTAAMMEFGKRLEPRHDPNLSDRDNIYNMRQAGMERKRIAHVVYGPWTTENEMKMKNRKVTNEFKRACEERGEESNHLLGRGVNVKAYRESFANGFVFMFRSRLERLRAAQAEEGSGLVLVSRKEKVDESFYIRFPQRRPSNEPAKPWRSPTADCAKCAKAKSGYCREHNYLKPSTAQSRGSKVNMSAYRRGGSAAALVDLGANSTGRGRVQSGDSKAIQQ